MSKGVTLIAVGGNGYLDWAKNIACSIKYHSPDIAIQLITSKKLNDGAVIYSSLFDFIRVVNESDFTDEKGRLFPAKLKTCYYKYLEFDETIYLDVDGVILKDITPLFDQQTDFVSEVQGVYEKGGEREWQKMKWAKPDEVWNHFGLNATDKLPALNSSFTFIRKGVFAESIFDLAHTLLMENEMPIDKQWLSWGRRNEMKNSQPDELYFNVALAMLGIVPKSIRPIYFRLSNEHPEYPNIETIRENHYGLGLFGQLQTNHRNNRLYYDAEMKKIWSEFMKQPFYNDCERLGRTKFANI